MIKNPHEPGLGPEHPYGDFIQFLMFVLFFVILGLDSFIYGFSTLSDLLPLYIRVVISIPVFVLGGYLAVKSHFVIFRIEGEDELVEKGLYSLVRHPMYLGGLLFFLGFVILTFSILSFLIWCGLFAVYDWLASYEENELIRLLGEEYEKYQEEVPKWIPV